MFRQVLGTMLATSALATRALAGDHLLFGPAAAWVVPVAAPAAPPSTSDSAPVTILLNDQQSFLDKGQRETFSAAVYRIDTAQGLDAGNVSVSWDPATENVTIHKLIVHRGAETIDILKSGQSFTVLRRETNLEAGMFDGQLTATLQPEGLRIGDTIELVASIAHADPVTKDNVEVELATFNGNPIARGHARLSWPTSLALSFRTTNGLPPVKVVRHGDISTIDYDLKDIEPLVFPAGAPARFQIGRALDSSTYSDWGAIAALMKPYFDAAAIIPAQGPLRAEVEKIRALPGGDRRHAEAALALVQKEVRYVALNMGAGGYVPASAETSWTRRFGDCKAKTALLLAILHELHIASEAVLANSNGSDGLDQRQPMLALFNHVLVRAHVAGKDVWLDGTRSGDASLDLLRTPAFGWGLPVLPGAKLVRMMLEAFDRPMFEVALTIDAREGIRLAAPATVDYLFRGDAALSVRRMIEAAPASQRDHYLREFFKAAAGEWKTSIVSLDADEVSSAFDATTSEMRLSLKGKATLDWSDRHLYLEFASLAFKPNFERTAGPNRDAPLAIDFPNFTRMVETIRLPQEFIDRAHPIPDVDATLAGVHYHRHANFTGDAFAVETSERSIASEVPYAEALASSARIRELNNRALQILVPAGYVRRDKEMAAWQAETLTTAADYFARASALLDKFRWDDALADFDRVLALDPKNANALAGRALAYVWKDDQAHTSQALDAAAAVDPKNAVLLRARGLFAQRHENWKVASDAFTASLASDPGDAFALGHRAQAFAALHRDDEALADAAASLAQDPGWTELRLLRGNILLKRKQCDEVAKEAEAAIARSDKDSYALVIGARLYFLCKRPTEAFAAFDKAIATKPDPLIYLNRAISRPLTDRAGRMADIDAALKLAPNDTGALLNKAQELTSLGKRGEALLLVDRALKVEPGAFDIETQRAALLGRLNRNAEATKLFAELRARADKSSELNSLCWVKAVNGIMLDSALDDCHAALRLAPESAAISDSLGLVLLRLGRFDEAINAYDAAIAGRTGAISLMGRALAHAGKGDKAKAEADRLAALDDDPNIAARIAEYGLSF